MNKKISKNPKVNIETKSKIYFWYFILFLFVLFLSCTIYFFIKDDNFLTDWKFWTFALLSLMSLSINIFSYLNKGKLNIEVV